MSNSNLGGTRMLNSFNENFLNECDQDANSVLTELDKGKQFVENITCKIIYLKTNSVIQVCVHLKSANNAKQLFGFQSYLRSIHFPF